jgi:hypothetical protein
MMADLFGVARRAVDPALKGFTKNGVKRFFHAEIHDRISESEDECSTKSIDDAFLFKSLQDERSIGHAHHESL